MQPHIAYGLMLSSEDFLNHVQEYKEVSSREKLAQKLFKEYGEKLTREMKEKLATDPFRFFLGHVANLLEHFPGLTIEPMKNYTYVFIGTAEQFNSRWQNPQYLYTVEDIFPKSEQKELKTKLREYGFPASRCQFYFGLTIIQDLLPVPKKD